MFLQTHSIKWKMVLNNMFGLIELYNLNVHNIYIL